MATLDDVQNAMVDTITPALYPNGVMSPSIAGVDIFIYPGDPLKENLDADLKAGKIHVSIFAMKGMNRNTTRLPPESADYLIDSATILVTVSGNTVTLGGTVTTGQAVMIIVAGTGYAYAALSNDTLNTIASALAAQIPGASALNNVITITSSFDIQARVSVGGSARKIVYSQESMFSVDIITPSQPLRETVSRVIDLLFSSRYLLMPDNIAASIRRNTINEFNKYELALAFERQYIYKVEYHSVAVERYQTITDPYIIKDVGFLPLS